MPGFDDKSQAAATEQRLRVTCLLFAGTRELFGTERLELELVPNSTTGELRQRLLELAPAGAGLLKACRLAISGEFVEDDRPLHDGDEVAVIPPVSGGEGEGAVVAEVSSSPIDVARWISYVATPRAGAIVTFLGTVREFTGDKQTRELEYEAYHDMAGRKLREIAELARVRFDLTRVAVVHRIGKLSIGEVSVLIAVSSPHRAQAFDGCRFIIEAIKRDVPIWKKEVWVDGSYEWVHPGTQ